MERNRPCWRPYTEYLLARREALRTQHQELRDERVAQEALAEAEVERREPAGTKREKA